MIESDVREIGLVAGVAARDDIGHQSPGVTNDVFVTQQTAVAHPEPLEVAPVGLGPRVRRAHLRASLVLRRPRRRAAPAGAMRRLPCHTRTARCSTVQVSGNRSTRDDVWPHARHGYPTHAL